MMNRILIVAIASLLAGCQHPALDRETILSDKAPAAIGPYSQAIRVGNRLGAFTIRWSHAASFSVGVKASLERSCVLPAL